MQTTMKQAFKVSELGPFACCILPAQTRHPWPIC
jgi:hypothetical protein